MSNMRFWVLDYVCYFWVLFVFYSFLFFLAVTIEIPRAFRPFTDGARRVDCRANPSPSSA